MMARTTAQRLTGAGLAFLLAAAAYLLAGWRGWSLWSLHLFEATEAMAAWRAGGQAAAAFAGPQGVFPLAPYLTALAGGSSDALRVVAALVGAGTVGLVYAWAARARGPVAGAAAAVALGASPVWVGAVQATSPTVFTVFGLVAVWTALRASLEDARWTPALWLAACVAAQTSFLGWLVWLPAGWLLLAPARRGVDFGLVRVRAVPLGALVAPVIGIGSLLLYAWFRSDSGDRIGDLLRVWMERPAEPFLAGGERFGPHRLDAWLPPALWWRSTPLWVSLSALTTLALAWEPVRRLAGLPGVVGAGDDGEAFRFAGVALVAAWLLPVGFGTVWFAGADLLAVGAVPLAVLAGVGVGHAIEELQAARGRVVALAVAAALVGGGLASSAADIRRSQGVAEAYAPGALGGTPGKLRAGMSRASHVPLHPDWAVEAVRMADGGGVAILSNAWEGRPLFDTYARLGVLPGPVSWAPPLEARVVVVWFDDALPELYDQAADVASLRRRAVERYEVVVDGVPIWGAYRLH